MSTNHRFLVLGACGNVGQWVAHELAARHPQSTVLASVRPNGMSPPPAHWQAFGNVEPILVDLDEPASIAAALRGVDRVFFVPQNTPKQLEHDRNVLAAIEESGAVDFYVRQTTYAEVCRADSACAFLAMHAEAEAALARSSVPHALLRLNCAMANVFFLVLPSLPYGTVRLPFPADLRLGHVDPRDAGAIGAALLASPDPAERDGWELRVMGPALDGVADVVGRVAAACGVEADYAPIDAAPFKQMMREGANMSEWMADAAGEVLCALRDECLSGAMHVDDTGPDGLLPFEATVGRPRHGFADFLEFFTVPDAYARMRQHSRDNPSY